MDFHIRPFRSSDEADLMQAWERANALAHPFLDAAFVAQVRHDIPALYLPNTETHVAEVKSKVVGFISMMGHEIGAIFLDPAFHGFGIGQAMINQVHKQHDVLEVEVFKNNHIGRRFYQAYGFELMEQQFHEASGHDVLRLKYVAN